MGRDADANGYLDRFSQHAKNHVFNLYHLGETKNVSEYLVICKSSNRRNISSKLPRVGRRQICGKQERLP